MSNDKSTITILTDTLAIMTERAMIAERDLAAKTAESSDWYSYYNTQKARADKLEQDLQATHEQLTEANASIGLMRVELDALRGGSDHE